VSATGATRLFGGLDEAGLGPLLGPLTLGFSVFRAPAGSTDLWRTLAGVVSQQASSGAPFVVADSKKVFARTPRSAARLEATALGFLGLLDPHGRPPATASQLAWRCPAELAPPEEALRDHRWYAGLDAPLPRFQDAGRLELQVEKLARAMRGAHVELVDAGVRVLPEGELNRSFARTGNKSATHWESSAAVMRRLWDLHGVEGLHLVVDRHGGRSHYGAPLARAFPDARVELVVEKPSLAEYLLAERDGPRRLRILFAERAERRSFATALASCLAKYAREACMQAFNAYFCDLAPELKPTAGYTQDGRRWLADAAPHLERVGLDPRELVRQR
jgi:hypothetical protein